MSRLTSCLAAIIAVCALAQDGAADAPRFAAMLAGGQRIAGNQLQDWHHPGGNPRLDGRELMNAGNPLSWLRDRTLHPAAPPESYIEMISGDRLPGEVISFTDSDEFTQWQSLPAHFAVRPAVSVNPPNVPQPDQVRVVRRFVRRIVWQPRGDSDAYQPGTLFYRDGRMLKFRAARFSRDRVHVLQSAGHKSVAFRAIAQLHLPEEDAWEGYFDELAVLSPRGEDRLLQIDSTDGLVATGSKMQFNAVSHGDAADANNWYHAVQPAWCLDTLWTNNKRIWLRRSWPPEQVPLSHISPAEAKSRGFLATGENDWQRNRNVKRRVLQSGGESHGWGFGVHAYSELHFPLPQVATAFRTRVGLDDVIGQGGCAIGRIYLNTVDGKPLFESPRIVGAKTVHDTQVVNLPAAENNRRKLILQVDPAHEGRPQGADPLDIRDVVDWLDPVVMLDRAKLLAEIARRAPSRAPAFEGWNVALQPDGDYQWRSEYLQLDGSAASYLPMLTTVNQSLVLRRKITVDASDHWLIVSAFRLQGESPEPEIVVRIDGIDMLAAPIPQRKTAHVPNPIAVSLTPYRGHTIDVEVIQRPTVNAGFSPVIWHALEVSDQLPMLFRALEDDEATQPAGQVGDATAKWIESEKHVGARSLEISGGGKFLLRFASPVSIRAQPRPGEQRYLRFAVRKFGQGQVRVELEHSKMKQKPAIYSAGIPIAPPQKEQPPDPAKHIWQQELPQQWHMMFRDVFADYVDLDVTGIILEVPDGGRACFDHIYFGGAAEDYKQLPDVPPPQATSEQGRLELAAAVVERGQAATVALYIDGRQATGVLVGGEGYVLTAGHLLGGTNKPCEVHLRSGQRLPATTRGIFRNADLGLVQITDRMDLPLPGLDLLDAKQIPTNQLYVVFEMEPVAEEFYGAAEHVAVIEGDLCEMLWTDFRSDGQKCGGPLLARDGRIVGIQLLDCRFGGSLYAKSFVAREHWERLKKGEVWGEWFAGTGPTLGLELIVARDRIQVNKVPADSPAQQADVQAGDALTQLEGQPVTSIDDVHRILAAKDPGQEINAELTRGDQKVQKKLKLMPPPW